MFRGLRPPDKIRRSHVCCRGTHCPGTSRRQAEHFDQPGRTVSAKSILNHLGQFRHLFVATYQGPDSPLKLKGVRRRLASIFGWNNYESFLNIGRQALGLPLAKTGERDPNSLSAQDMREQRGFFTVPFSDNMCLAAGEGRSIPITDEADQSVIVVPGPSIGRYSARNLQTFRVGRPSMEPLIADGGIILADLSHNDIRHIKDGRIYVLCWDLEERKCAVKYLRWFEKGKIISSP